MNVRSIPLKALVLLALLLPGLLLAQEKPDDDSVVQRIQAISRKAKAVSSATQFSQVIAECDAILALQLTNDSHRKYLKTLLAWALDKRGVTRTELSDRFRKAGSLDQANVIDTQAQDDFSRAITTDPNRWQTLMHRGEFFSRKNRYADAVQDYSAVVRLQPKSTDAWFNRAELRFQLKEYKDSIGDYDQVLKMEPGDVQAISGRAHCHLALQDFSQALTDYDTVVESLPADGWALANRADAHLAMRQWKKARTDLERSIDLRTNGEFCRRLAWLLATCPEETVSDGNQSLRMARRAIEITGETPENLDTLAAAFAADGQFDQARDVYARVIAMQGPDDPNTAVKQAAYQNNERYQERFDR